MERKGFLSKFDFLESAIKNRKLNLEDIAILMDSDKVFDINSFLDHFIWKPTAVPGKLDSLFLRWNRSCLALGLAVGNRTCPRVGLNASLDLTRFKKKFRGIPPQTRSIILFFLQVYHKNGI
ncbi:unnamed protein product [Phytomonas sp. Hart1]|nr:unnamed protein product [Phytomonas sp. Hart1]|eukprot:CCW71422.1 unnamed protein product [Phytomonas sp. isolate Hart1]